MSAAKLILFVLLLANFIIPQVNIIDNSLVDKISAQLLKKVEIIGTKFPEYTVNGSWKVGNDVNWFSGFLAGELWRMYDITGKSEFKKFAIAQADNLLPHSGVDNTHDVGFIFFTSCVKAYKETGEKKYLDALLNAAEMLAKRFNKNGNFIRAWGSLNDPERAGWSIIDTMMNLELLFWAAQQSGNKELYDIAYMHALTTLNVIVRENYSSYHLAEFDPSNGNVINKRTHQGYKDESTWARGQAWGLYGFANAYKYTRDAKFLTASSKMADYFLNNLPDDLVPTWDLDLKDQKNVLRDASAGAIAASGLFLLSELTRSKDDSIKYLDYAKKITSSLCSNYLFFNSQREKEEGILLHTIYHYHNKWGVDESFPAGDYYFLEAFSKLHNHLK